jgi:hypothetical protein
VSSRWCVDEHTVVDELHADRPRRFGAWSASAVVRNASRRSFHSSARAARTSVIGLDVGAVEAAAGVDTHVQQPELAQQLEVGARRR